MHCAHDRLYNLDIHDFLESRFLSRSQAFLERTCLEREIREALSVAAGPPDCGQPGKLPWNLKMGPLLIPILFNGPPRRFHVGFPESSFQSFQELKRSCNLFHSRSEARDSLQGMRYVVYNRNLRECTENMTDQKQREFLARFYPEQVCDLAASEHGGPSMAYLQIIPSIILGPTIP